MWGRVRTQRALPPAQVRFSDQQEYTIREKGIPVVPASRTQGLPLVQSGNERSLQVCACGHLVEKGLSLSCDTYAEMVLFKAFESGKFNTSHCCTSHQRPLRSQQPQKGRDAIHSF